MKGIPMIGFLNQPFVVATAITALAGLATAFGGLLAFTRFVESKRCFAFLLGLSAGVMIYVSMLEIVPKAISSLTMAAGDAGYTIATIGFFGGLLLIALVDRFFDRIHQADNLSESVAIQSDQLANRQLLSRMGLFMALAVTIHNLPEGLATFIASIEAPALGLAFALAIGIHNIPEGIAVALPIYKATGNRQRAFWLAAASGVAEPVGAVIGYFLLIQFVSDYHFGIIFAGVAGVMMYVSLDQLLPVAKQHDHHLPIVGVIAGMAIMATSLVLFRG